MSEIQAEQPMSPSQVGPQSEHTASHVKLTDEEASQLERFSQGRAKIEHDLDTLESRPIIDAFANFTADLNERSIASITALWSTLDEQQGQCLQWKEENDRIEDQTVQFDSADMESLRRLAKGVLPLHCSRVFFLLTFFTQLPPNSRLQSKHVSFGY